MERQEDEDQSGDEKRKEKERIENPNYTFGPEANDQESQSFIDRMRRIARRPVKKKKQGGKRRSQEAQQRRIAVPHLCNDGALRS